MSAMLQVDQTRQAITIKARDTKYLPVGASLGVYSGDQLLLLGSTTVTGFKQVTDR
jgi:hypothetical protein